MITAVLLNWRRPYHLPGIVESLRRYPQIDEIFLWQNSKGTFDLPGVRMLTCGKNVCTYGRFLAAAEAKNEIVYTQDDDVLVHNIPQLLEAFLAHQERITAGLVDSHYRVEAHKTPFLQLGWGSIFLKDWIHCLNQWIDRYGEDELLHRKADRIFTILHGKHEPLRADVEHLTDPVTGGHSDRDVNSLWLRKDHYELTKRAVAKALALRGAA